ncbi:MAG: mandelate racemase/muconate lactonizing enzyme family protein [Chloroflexota bacterium]
MSPNVRVHPLAGVRRQEIKITDLKVLLLSYLLKRDEQWPDGDQHVVIWQTTEVIVQVFTDVGLVGLGTASRYNDPERMKAYAENVIRPFLLGKNPYDVEVLSGGMCAHGALNVWAGVDVALWDIIARAQGVPLCRLLAVDGEPASRVRVYASGGEYSWKKGSRFPGPENLIAEALRYKAMGHTAFKFRPGAGFQMLKVPMSEHAANIRRIRAAVGPIFDLIQESNCRWTMAQCLEIAPVLEELGFLWWEEPTSKRGDDAIDSYLRIKAQVPSVMISGGENVPNRGAISEWVQRGAYDIVQHGTDDAGLTEAWHMARMAGARAKRLCAHNWQGGLVTMGNLHLMAAMPNRFLLESNMTANPLKEGLFKQRLAVQNGYLDVPTGPGLGVTLREGLEEEYPYLPGRGTRARRNWDSAWPHLPRTSAQRGVCVPIARRRPGT